MRNIYFLKKIITEKEFSKLYLLLILMIIAASLEMLSIGLILPMASFFLEPDKNIFIIELFNSVGFDLSKKNFLIFLMLSIMTVFILKNIYIIFYTWLQIKYMSNLKAKLAHRLFNWYLHNSYSTHIKNSKAFFIRNCTNEIDVTLNQFLMPLLIMTLNFTTITFILILLLYYSFIPTLIIISVFTLVGLIFNFFVKEKLRHIGLQRQENQYFQLRYLQEALQGIKEVKLFNLEKFFLNMFNYYNYRFAVLGIKKTIIGSLPKQIYEILFIFCIFSVLMIWIYLEKNINSLIPIIAIYGFSAFRILPSINSIALNYQKIKFAGPALELLSKEISQIPIVKKNSTLDKKLTFNNFIDIQALTFKYNSSSQQNLLNNVNLRINKFSKIGITGANGSGKSTFINLLCGLLEPNEGSIKLDGVNIKNFLHQWHNLIGYVSQSPFLIDDTIINNITLGVEIKDIDNKKINKVLELSQLNDSIKNLYDGINTIVGEDGKKLSGGQKQKISIARALYKQSEILILDEPTSAMDAESEMNFIKNFIRKNFDKTIIIITHEQELLRSCDEIYKIKDQNILKI